jgi:hypothetical protein
MRACATACRYVGSPYQTSLSEAGQDKFFYCVQRSPVTAEELATARPTAVTSSEPSKLDTSLTTGQGLKWRETERWVVSIGSKIIKVGFASCVLL